MRYLVLGLCLCGYLCVPAWSLATSQVPAEQKIVKILVYETHANVFYEPGFHNSEGCSHADADRVALIRMSDTGGKYLFSTALSAFHAGTTVGFGLDGCDGSKPKAYRINIAQ